MSRIAITLLTLGLSLSPVLCFAEEPNANQAPAPPQPQPLPPPQELLPTRPEPPTTLADLLPKASDNDATLLKAAQDERIKVLRQLVESLLLQYREGTVDYNQLGSAQNELSSAMLDSTDDPAKRVALLEKQLVMANDVFRIVKARVDSGTVTIADACRAKVVFLDIKVKLLRERSRKRLPMPNPTGKQP